MITLEEARALLLAGVAPLESEKIPLGEAFGRTLAAEITATFDQPALPMSAMDGYAMTAGDAVAGARLMVVGEAYAGTPFARPIAAGETVRIATGGVVPRNADRIIIQEIVHRDGDTLVIDGLLHDAQFVRPAGGDFRAGERLFATGERLTAANLGLAAAAGMATVDVRRRPRIALFASGDELRQPGAVLGPGQVIDSASFALAALIERWGALADRRATLPDDHDRAMALIAAATGADVMLFIGGASVGDRDVLRAVVADLGAAIAFDKIAVQPGKPCWHARFEDGRFGDGRLLLGLPGNPASAFVCAHLLLEPLIAALLGRLSRRLTSPARLAVDLPPGGPRETWWRAHLSIDDGGQRLVTPDPRRDSSLQRPLAEANALLRQPAGALLDAGAVVEVLALD